MYMSDQTIIKIICDDINNHVRNHIKTYRVTLKRQLNIEKHIKQFGADHNFDDDVGYSINNLKSILYVRRILRNKNLALLEKKNKNSLIRGTAEYSLKQIMT